MLSTDHGMSSINNSSGIKQMASVFATVTMATVVLLLKGKDRL